VIDLSCSPEALVSGSQGVITIASNDKNNGQTTVNLTCDAGISAFQCYPTQLDFGQTEITLPLYISNMGSGLMIWKIDSCPEWLTASATSGFFYPHSSNTLTFTCDRSLLPNNIQSQTIYFKTNDPENPSYAITVTVDNTQPENPDSE
jgi:hypothetical protein